MSDTTLPGDAREAPQAKVQEGIGLCLSGGGFRATLFNLGSLWRLNDSGVLPKLRMVTSVSGGSITSGVLATAWKQLAFDASGVSPRFKDLVARPLQEFCRRDIAIPAAVWGMVNPFKSIGDEMVGFYEDLFGKKTLQDLPADAAPDFVFYATNLQTGASVRMHRRYLADYRIGLIPNPKIRLAQAVAASSAFPPVLSPQCIDLDPGLWQPIEGAEADLPAEIKNHMVLTDGGVYDNMGLEAVFDRWSTVLVSDAGAPLKIEASPHTDWTRQLVRVMDIITDQTRALRKRWLVRDFQAGERRGTYWGIRTQVASYELPDPMVRDSDITRQLASIRTQLDPFTPEEQGHLINWGYALCDTALRRWVPELANTPKPVALPIPEFPI